MRLNFDFFSPDVRTQAMFQLLDPGFVGLIFSCFSEDAQKVGKLILCVHIKVTSYLGHLCMVLSR